MRYETNETKTLLTIFVDEDERKELAEEKEENEDFQSNRFMYEFLEDLTCNSELTWLSAEDTGDLTDAPILGILASEEEMQTEPGGPFGSTQIGFWDGSPRYLPIIHRWAFMQYETVSVQELLLTQGYCTFVA